MNKEVVETVVEEKRESIIEYVKDRIKGSKSFLVVMALFLVICFDFIIYFMIKKLTRSLILSLISAFVFTPMIVAFEYYTGIKFGTPLLSMILFIILGGMILGPSLDFYFKFPHWDTLLHGLSGFVFACFGFAFAEKFIKSNQSNAFYVYLIAGFLISISIAALWEMFEYMGTFFMGLDMQEDQVINSFNSYYFSGSHSEVFTVDNITKTIIYYGNNEYLIVDGYLDIGLYDTLNDILICLGGNVLFLTTMLVDHNHNGKLKQWFIPQVEKK